MAFTCISHVSIMHKQMPSHPPSVWSANAGLCKKSVYVHDTYERGLCNIWYDLVFIKIIASQALFWMVELKVGYYLFFIIVNEWH